MWSVLVLVFLMKLSEATENTTKLELQNKTERVIQPSQTQQIDTIQSLNSSKKIDDFKPSPHLETYYEYNKFPVPPVLPESKQLPNYGIYSTAEEQIPPTRVKFPVQDYYSRDRGKHGFNFNQLVPVENEEFERRPPVQKSHFDYNLPVEKTNSDVFGAPWKNIIKFLTAIIPIGLLISALTPSFITITPLNDTTKNRAIDQESEKYDHLKKLPDFACEDRVFCELILSSTSSKNGEQHVNDLLKIYSERGRFDERIEDIKKVFKAITDQDCSTIICTHINREIT